MQHVWEHLNEKKPYISLNHVHPVFPHGPDVHRDIDFTSPLPFPVECIQSNVRTGSSDSRTIKVLNINGKIYLV